jgi:quercetin dioxygenase-like cupin family protein
VIARTFMLGAQRGRVRLAGSDTGHALAVVEVESPAGQAAPWHVHHRDDETFYVLEGQIDLHVGDATERVEAGGLAHAPKGIPHTLTVVTETARWLVLCTPAGFERFALAAAADPARIAELAEEHGMEILGASA